MKLYLFQNSRYGTVVAKSETDAATVWTQETGESGGYAMRYGWQQIPNGQNYTLKVPINHATPPGATVRKNKFIRFANNVTATAGEWVKFRGRGRLA